MCGIHTILHPTDFSRTSAQAFAVATSLARDHRARLVLLHIAEEPAFIDGTGLVPFDPAMYRSELFNKLEQLAVRAPGIEVETRLAEGNPVSAVLRVAGEIHSDLIVMGTHGWTGLRRFLMGSVAEKVVRQAHCPVLSVCAPAWPEAAETAPPEEATERPAESAVP
jgi:nucleotide-binding universal stress UspA family protein